MGLQRRVLFIDSALPDEIESALKRGVQGVTTNPSLVSKVPTGDSSKDFMDRYLDHMRKLTELCKKYEDARGDKPSLSVEVFSLDPKEMIEQAKKIKESLDYENLVIKIPISYSDGKISRDYLGVIKDLASKDIRVNATCGFSASQLELAAQAGASFVSLFYNRLIDYFNGLPNSKGNGQELALNELRKTRQYLDDNPKLDCEIILGSIRNGYDVDNGWENGADIVTAGAKVLPNMIYHPATNASVKGFDEDLKNWLSDKNAP